MLAGVMLIDRNDELCVMYEKANVQVRHAGLAPAIQTDISLLNVTT
jgi:hypothetical protein